MCLLQNHILQHHRFCIHAKLYQTKDLLNTFFHSVFTQDNGHALKLNCKVTRLQFMKDVIVTEADVAQINTEI